MTRPRVICHMLASVDGRIVTGGWPLSPDARRSNDIDGDHVVAVLSERVSDESLAFLRGRGVSYLLCGRRDVDLALALEAVERRADGVVWLRYRVERRVE